MKILCIQDGHNASASLMINGEIILALQEERFNEIKNYTGYPHQSVQYCLNFLKKEKLLFLCFIRIFLIASLYFIVRNRIKYIHLA